MPGCLTLPQDGEKRGGGGWSAADGPPKVPQLRNSATPAGSRQQAASNATQRNVTVPPGKYNYSSETTAVITLIHFFNPWVGGLYPTHTLAQPCTLCGRR